jgi:hypothetical protein
MSASAPPADTSLSRRLLPASTFCTVAGVHAGLWLAAPTVAGLLLVTEAVLVVVVVVTALYAPERISDRAFRMLPWTTPAPSGQPTGSGSAQPVSPPVDIDATSLSLPKPQR